ncbi:MAG: thioester reductase domain-containing protein, partial [Candidatus Latescibacterota bacterium]
FPSSNAHILDFVKHNWLLDLSPITETDTQRTRWVQEDLRRKKAQDHLPSYAAFIEDLQLQIHLSAMKAEHIARVSQLTQRTNQFNTTTIRQTEEEVRQLMVHKNIQIEVVHVKDRFGDYGLVGLMVLECAHKLAVLKSLILSCRVLGRGVEHAMIAKAAKIAKHQGFDHLQIQFTPSHRNEPAKAFLDQLPHIKKGAQSITCNMDALLNLKFAPDSLQEHSTNQKAHPNDVQGVSFTKTRIDINTWLQAWQNAKIPEDFVARLRSFKRPRLPLHKRVPPQTKTEKQLASIWERTLNIEHTCVISSFYELGGTSIALAQVLSEIRTTLQIPLPFHLFLTHTNIRNVAQLIERFESTGSFEEHAFPDLLTDATLPEHMQQAIHHAKPAKTLDRTKPLCVLLTGATGYVGAFLLQELLTQTAWHVACLVRAQDAENGFARVKANLETYGFCPNRLQDRVDIVVGDLSQKQFGLTQSEFEHLGTQISGIYHNGAQVDFTRSYTELKAANLDGTKTCVHLASMGILKPLFYVSTASVFDSDMFHNDQEIDETALSPETHRVHGGYAQSKWAAEHVVTQAANSGLPVAIFRPNGIGPSLDPNHARFNDDDAFALVLLASLNLGMFFDLPIHVDFSPVDYIASALIEISLQPFSPGQIFALTNPQPTTLEHVRTLLEDLGESVALVDYATWVHAITKHAHETQNHKLLALLPLMQEPITPQGQTWFELGATRPRFACQKTLTKLQTTNITCPNVNHNTMMHLLLLSFLHANYETSQNAPPLLKNSTATTNT